ncbi:MAG: ferredoxin [Candidatus Gastranaerophilales bacterium]|nr:ferredoxin [Candidatus Gastranaerophilales bacterium]
MKVEILDTCTACGLCESINNEVFKVNDMAHVTNSKIKGNEDDCRLAAAQCPAGAIIISE